MDQDNNIAKSETGGSAIPADGEGECVEFGDEFERLKHLDGIEGIVFITKAGEVMWSWQHEGVALNIRTMRLVEMIKSLIPIMLDMPELGVQRTLFQFDYDKKSITMYFTNIGDHAFIGCILGAKFDYINVTVEVAKVSFTLNKRLSRTCIEPEELNQFIKEAMSRASISISSSVNQFSRIAKRGKMKGAGQ